MGPTKTFVKKIITRGRSLLSGQDEGLSTQSENVPDPEVHVGRDVHAEREEEVEHTNEPQPARQVIQMVDVGQLQNNLMGMFEERFNDMSRDIATRSKKLAKKVDKKLQSRTKSIANRENREQYEFNVGILEHLEELETMRDMEGVGRRVTNKIADLKEDIEYRNKLILIADSSESTWDTVQEYKKRDLADDSDDEKKLRMAENRAKRMRLARPGQGASRFRPRAPSATIVGPQQIFTNNTSQPIAVPLMPNVQQATFRPPTAFGSAPFLQASQVRHPVPRDICLTCGESGHWSYQCPRRYQARGGG